MIAADPVLTRKPPPPIPVTILTGFLGAGKTTLLNRLLADPALKDTLVLVNEFGEIGLDHLLIENVDGDMLLMASGCLCCTIRGDLVQALEDILRKRDNLRTSPFNRVVIETTGLADPIPILQAIMGHPYLTLRFRLDGVVTVVDAVNGLATIMHHKEALRQVAVADRLVLTKHDLAGEYGADTSALLNHLTRLNPAAPVLDAARGEVTTASLLSAGLFDAKSKIPDVERWLHTADYETHTDQQGHAHGSHMHNTSHHEHDSNRHNSHIHAFALTRDIPLPPSVFALFFDLLRHAHGPRLLRVKGIVALADDPDKPVVIHGVQHLFHPPVRLDGWPDSDHRTRIVFIVEGVERAFIEGLFLAALGEISPDGADGLALRDNPLAPSAGGLFLAQ